MPGRPTTGTENAAPPNGLLTDRGSDFVAERAVTVVVIACPHALGLAVPLVIAISTTVAASSGLLVRTTIPT